MNAIFPFPKKSSPRARSIRSFLIRTLAISILLILGGCRSNRPNGEPIRIGVTRDPEQILLGEISARFLEHKGFRVQRVPHLQDRHAVRLALESGSIDLGWLYTGEAWLQYLGHDQRIANAERLQVRLQEEDKLRGLAWLPPIRWENRWTLLMAAEKAKAHSVYNLSDLATYMRTVDPTAAICLPDDAPGARKTLEATAQFYGLSLSQKTVLTIPFDELGDKLLAGACTVAWGTASQAALMGESPYQITPLADDRGYAQSSLLALVVRRRTLQAQPDLEQTLVELTAALTPEALAEMERETILEGRNPGKVARRWLKRLERE